MDYIVDGNASASGEVILAGSFCRSSVIFFGLNVSVLHIQDLTLDGSAVAFSNTTVSSFLADGSLGGFVILRESSMLTFELSCNGKPMGSVFETAASPALQFAVKGTAPIRRVTLVRNETDHQTFEPGQKEFTANYRDEQPLDGENRYYLRVEQADGNMAWSSPVWVTVKK